MRKVYWLSVTFLILVKIRAKDTERQPILNVTEIFHGKIVDVTHDSMVIELTGHQDKLEAFLDLLQGYDILELARTGIRAVQRNSGCKNYGIAKDFSSKNKEDIKWQQKFFIRKTVISHY